MSVIVQGLHGMKISHCSMGTTELERFLITEDKHVIQVTVECELSGSFWNAYRRLTRIRLFIVQKATVSASFFFHRRWQARDAGKS